MGRRVILRATLLVLLLAAVVPWRLATAPLPALAGHADAAPAAPASGPGFRLPLAGSATVTRPFEPPPQPWAAGHRGVDLAGEPGETVFAAGAGTVAFAGSVAGVGVVSIDHAGGLRTTYQPVVALVAAGQSVVAGQPIGTLLAGHDGCPVAACLHWGLRHGEVYLDPMSLLGTGQVRLYPAG